MSQSNPASVIRFLHVIENLKRTKRTGWLDNGIKGAESIADHMHRMGIMAMLVNDPSINRERYTLLLLVFYFCH
ncbi:hypothetical protein INT48_009324 [Thamnidium elegans]|uniref:HD domain-containing protein n=1 Tax=Thamnidium elegans TaxID=101142 RepID=A0A8H7SQH4_9FUNG|nr:hypothetical protein INT48_009324 [Thamnidium elegans]